MEKIHRTDAYIDIRAGRITVRGMPVSTYEDDGAKAQLLERLTHEQHGLQVERAETIIKAHDTPPEMRDSEQRFIVAFASRPEGAEVARTSVRFYPDQRFRCGTCGTESVGLSRIRYCSNACREEAVIAQRTPYLPRQKSEKVCSHCGGGFIGSRADAQFCSAKCRVAAHRAKGG